MLDLVSVVIPTYNRSEELKRALESVLSQTYKNFEVIVVDNHSTDNTDDVMKGFTDPRITYLKIHNNGVIAASRNAGIRAAKGEWIAFLDSDDWWVSDKLQACFAGINENVDLVYHDLKIVTNQHRYFGRKTIKSWQVKVPVLTDLLRKGNPIINSSVVVRRCLLNKIGGINEDVGMIAAEDYNTWLHVATLTEKFIYIPRALGFYYIHDKSVSNKDMSFPTNLAIAEFIPLIEKNIQETVHANIKYISGRFNYLKGNYAEAINDLLFCVKYGRYQLKIKSLWMIVVMKVKARG